MSAQLSFSELFTAETPSPAPQFGPDLSPQQQRVRDLPGGNQVVVAGAGTGKTEALTQRILKLLIEGDENGPVELSQVVALTFTDKGAAEMRGRVYERLVRIGRDLPRGELRSRLETLRADFAENGRISTFDAFSYRILSQFPAHSPLAGEVEILDAATRAEMNREIARQFWSRIEASFSGAQQLELWELLAAFPSRRAALDAIAALAEGEIEADLRRLAILPPQAEWEAAFRYEAQGERDALWESVESAVTALEIPAALRAELLDRERILEGGRKGILVQKGWSADFKKRWNPEAFAGLARVEKRLLDWSAASARDRDPALDWKSRRLVAMLCDYALWWGRAAREWCDERGVASFSTIASAALEMIGDEEVAASLRSGISHLLIDEFQDTNWRQWALLDALRDKNIGNVLIVGDEKQAIFRFRGGDITVFDGVRKILLDGQIADELTVSRRSTRQIVEWTNHVFRQVLPSPKARRSFEAPFQDLQSETDFEGNGLWQLKPARWHFAPENELVAEKAPLAAIKDERAMRALARFLRALCDDAARWKSEAAPNLQFPDMGAISQKISRGQSAIGVVFTNHDLKSEAETQLRALDVPFVSVRGKGFWLGEAATLALHLLRISLDKSDRVALVGLARSPLGGVSDVALLEWHLALRARDENQSGAALNRDDLDLNRDDLDLNRGDLNPNYHDSRLNRDSSDVNQGDVDLHQGDASPHRGDVNGLADDSCTAIPGFLPSLEADARAWNLLVGRVEAWRDLARVAPFSEVLEAVLGESELAFHLAGAEGGAQNEANWRKIIDIVREREAAGQGGLRSLIDAFAALIEAAQDDDKEAEAALPSEAAIQLMTVWAAKGLGFPMTILAQLDAKPGFKATLLLRGDLEGKKQMALRLSDDPDDKKSPNPWAWEKLRDAASAEEEAQWRRLFYVACTRAESQLVLLWPENQAASAAAWMNLCQDEQRELREILPVDGVPRARKGALDGEVSAPPGALAPPLMRAAPREIALTDIAGAPAERFGARARAWLENRLEILGGAPENALQDVPFSTSARALGLETGEWLVGAWEWIAALPDDSVVLLASGESGEIAARRAELMRWAARDAGLVVRECWAVWASGAETEGRLVE